MKCIPALSQTSSVAAPSICNYLPLQSLSCRRIDHGYALALLLMVPPKQAIEKLHAMRSRSASSYSKVIVSGQTIISEVKLVSN